MSSAVAKFKLSSLSLKPINSIKDQPNCAFNICGQPFSLNGNLVPFLSLYAYQEFSQNPMPFSIEIPKPEHREEIFKNIDERSVISAFQQLISLLDGSPSIKVDSSNAPSLYFLAISLRNFALAKSIHISSQYSRSITLSSSALTSSDYTILPKEFSFVIETRRFSCPRFLSFFLSAKYCRTYVNEPFIDTLELTLPPGIGLQRFFELFSFVFGLLSGQTLYINIENAGIYMNIAHQLDNEELLSATASFIFSTTELSLLNIIPKLKSLAPIVSFYDISSVIDFAASHFYELDLMVICHIDPPILDLILKKQSLRLNDERSLLKFVGHCILAQGDQALPLINSVQFRYVDSKSIGEFLQIVHPQKIEHDVWQSICDRLKLGPPDPMTPDGRWINVVKPKELDGFEFEYIPSENSVEQFDKAIVLTKSFGHSKNPDGTENEDHDGVLAFFRAQSETNIIGLVGASASSMWFPNEGPEKVMDWDSTTYWFSKNDPGQWIQFDFKECRLQLESIDILPLYDGFPRSWVIEISVDGIEWKEAHKAVNDERFLYSNHQGHPIRIACDSPQESKFVRLTANDKNFNPNDCFFFCGIEFYGTISAPASSLVGDLITKCDDCNT